MTFTTSLDADARKKTRGYIATMIVLPVSAMFFFNSALLAAAYFLFFMLLFVLSYFHMPKSYRVTNNEIIIDRLIGKHIIPILHIQSIDTAHPAYFDDVTKGGVFGYAGKMRSIFGKVYWYATRRDKLVLIVTMDDQRKILTPDEPEDFVNAVIENHTAAMGMETT